MKVLLNIGMNPFDHPEGAPKVPTWRETFIRQNLIWIAHRMNLRYKDVKAWLSTKETEDTLIVELDVDSWGIGNRFSVASLAVLTRQMAIAVYQDDRTNPQGELLGPLAADWGTFNLDFFQFPPLDTPAHYTI